MAGNELPWFKFYTGDWLKDLALRSVSPAARALWIDMICMMHESERRGYLEVAMKSLSNRHVLQSCGALNSEGEKCLAELEEAGVFSRDERGCIYSRRMARESNKSRNCSDSGKLGAKARWNGKNATGAGPKKSPSNRHSEKYGESVAKESRSPHSEVRGQRSDIRGTDNRPPSPSTLNKETPLPSSVQDLNLESDGDGGRNNGEWTVTSLKNQLAIVFGSFMRVAGDSQKRQTDSLLRRIIDQGKVDEALALARAKVKYGSGNPWRMWLGKAHGVPSILE